LANHYCMWTGLSYAKLPIGCCENAVTEAPVAVGIHDLLSDLSLQSNAAATHSLPSPAQQATDASPANLSSSHPVLMTPNAFTSRYDHMYLKISAPCGLQGCKNRPTLFPGRMSCKATKPGLVLFYILACFNCIVVYFRSLFMYC